MHDRFYKGSFLFGRIISSVCSKFATYERADEIEKMFDDCKLELTSVKRVSDLMTHPLRFWLT